ncbi:MAG: preprotein translocase subunit SecY [Euryarchaeota archaeon RBG_16_68_13]|nr:MAG: preprotein translocase subunit SecY [Euryarchaeota archaeon RBG_16_68_13]
MPLEEQKKSRLYSLKPLTDRLPAVTRPDGHVQFRTKIFWVLLILVLYFALTNVFIYGLDRANVIDFFSSLRAILAGAQGSLMHLGIGPIVTGSIIMQLFAGAKIINLNLRDDEDKSVYQGTQKLLVIIMIFVEAVPQVFGFLTPSGSFVTNLNGGQLFGLIPAGNGNLLARILIVIQLFAGSYLVFLMDEVVSKWGIGSGISLFIAAGVSQQIFTGTFNWEASQAGSAVPAGTIPKTIYYLQNMPAGQIGSTGLEQIMFQPPNPLIALIGTMGIFLIVAYTESTRIELPLAHGAARGARGRYPIRLMYASNIPVILVAAVLANVSMFSLLFWQHPEWPYIGRNPLIGAYPGLDDPLVIAGIIQQTTPTEGLAYYLSNVNGVGDWLLPLFNPVTYGAYLRGHEYWQVLLRLLVYLGVMIGGSIMFAKFWIMTTNMGPEEVARQIESSGMQIPGFRRDPRILRRVLERYIPVVTIISGAFVGALAAGADMIGTVGSASGTGVLLAVGIMIQMYEAIGREQMMEMHPVLREWFGGR